MLHVLESSSEALTAVRLRILAVTAYAEHQSRGNHPPASAAVLELRRTAACLLASALEGGPGGKHSMGLSSLEQKLQAACPDTLHSPSMSASTGQASAIPLRYLWHEIADSAALKIIHPEGNLNHSSYMVLDPGMLEMKAMQVAVQVGHEQPASATASVPAVPPISVSSSTPKSQPLTPQPTPGAAAAAGHQSSRSTSSFATSPQAASHQTPQLPQQQQQSQQEASSSFQSQPLSTIPVPILHSLVTAVYSGNDNVTRMRRTLAGHLVTQTTGPVGPYSMLGATVGQIMNKAMPEVWEPIPKPKLPAVEDGVLMAVMGPKDAVLVLNIHQLKQRSKAVRAEAKASAAASKARVSTSAPGRPGSAHAGGDPAADPDDLASVIASHYHGDNTVMQARRALASSLARHTSGPAGPHSLLCSAAGQQLSRLAPHAWVSLYEMAAGKRPLMTLLEPSDGILEVSGTGAYKAVKLNVAALKQAVAAAPSKGTGAQARQPQQHLVMQQSYATAARPRAASSASAEQNGSKPATTPGAAAAEAKPAGSTTSKPFASPAVRSAANAKQWAAALYPGSDPSSRLRKVLIEILAGRLQGPLGPHSIRGTDAGVALRKVATSVVYAAAAQHGRKLAEMLQLGPNNDGVLTIHLDNANTAIVLDMNMLQSRATGVSGAPGGTLHADASATISVPALQGTTLEHQAYNKPLNPAALALTAACLATAWPRDLITAAASVAVVTAPEHHTKGGRHCCSSKWFAQEVMRLTKQQAVKARSPHKTMPVNYAQVRQLIVSSMPLVSFSIEGDTATLNMESLTGGIATAVYQTGDLPDLSTLPIQVTHRQASRYVSLLVSLQQLHQQQQGSEQNSNTPGGTSQQPSLLTQLLERSLQYCMQYTRSLSSTSDAKQDKDCSQVLASIEALITQAQTAIKAHSGPPAAHSVSSGVISNAASATMAAGQNGGAASTGGAQGAAAAGAPPSAAGLPAAGAGWVAAGNGGFPAPDFDIPAAWMAANTPPAGHTDATFHPAYGQASGGAEEQAGQEEEDFLALLLG